jgi:hypothetical protein
MEPSQKSPEMETFINSVTPNPMGRRGSIEAGMCSWCQQPAVTFNDALSLKEYRISGLCQMCQDKTFGEEE